MIGVLVIAAAAALTPAASQSENWYETATLRGDGFCSISSPCWSRAEESFFGGRSIPLPKGTVPPAGHAHYELTSADVERFKKGEVLKTVALDPDVAKSLLAVLEDAKDGVEFPWWAGLLDPHNVRMTLDGIHGPSEERRETSPRLRDAVAAGGTVFLLGDVVDDPEGHPWFWKRLVYSAGAGAEARVYYLGGGGAAINIIKAVGDTIPPGAVGGLRRTDTR